MHKREPDEEARDKQQKLLKQCENNTANRESGEQSEKREGRGQFWEENLPAVRKRKGVRVRCCVRENEVGPKAEVAT